jgi:hypothetical protein
MKLDLKDTTFCIPIRIDSNDRQENLEMVIDYLDHHFDTNIIVMESSEKSMLMHQPSMKKVKYIWEHNTSEVFHRTRILNDMLAETETKIWVNYDCDVLFPVQAYVDAANEIRNGKVFVFPYQGPFHEVPRKFLPEIRNKMDVSWIDLKQCGLNHPKSVGGAMFMDAEVYRKLGGEPATFKDWGYEDNYRTILYSKFGYEVNRVGTVLYHIDHWRGKSSSPSNPHHNENQMEYYKCSYMSKEELDRYISSWSQFRK